MRYFGKMVAAVLSNHFSYESAASFRPGVPRSPLAWAVAASILIHGFALGWIPDIRKMGAPLSEPLRVFMPPPRVPEPLPAAVPPAPTFKPAADAVPSRRSAPNDPPRPPQVLSRTVDAEPTASPGFSVPVQPEAPVPLVSDPPARPLPVAVRAAATPDPAALTAYGRSVAAAVAVHQKYPRLAQLRQWQGTALLQVELAADGLVREVRVLSSSGHEVLDRQAIDMVRAAQPLPPLPAPLADRSLTVDVPVVFRLSS